MAHLLRLQAPQGLLSFWRQLRSPVFRNWFLEKPRPPLLSLLFSSVGFLALPLFELLFQICGLCIFFFKDCCCHAVPEAA